MTELANIARRSPSLCEAALPAAGPDAAVRVACWHAAPRDLVDGAEQAAKKKKRGAA